MPAGISGHFPDCRLLVPALALALLLAAPAQAPAAMSTPDDTLRLLTWDGTLPASLEELQSLARTLGDLLQRAGERVDRLAGDAPEGEVMAAVRHELDLSRRWNRHLGAMLLQVVEARRRLGRRERQAAAEIAALAAAADEARQELVALKNAINTTRQPAHGVGTGPVVRPQAGREEGRRSSLGPAATDSRAAAVDPAAIDRRLADARHSLAHLQATQTAVIDDIAKVRARIMEALGRLTTVPAGMPADRKAEGSLSPEAIDAWAASIAGKLHAEGIDDEPLAAVPVRLPSVEGMLMDGKALTAAPVRAAPDHAAARIAVLPAGGRVRVTGKVIDRDWYRIDMADGRPGFVSSDLIRRQATLAKPS